MFGFVGHTCGSLVWPQPQNYRMNEWSVHVVWSKVAMTQSDIQSPLQAAVIIYAKVKTLSSYQSLKKDSIQTKVWSGLYQCDFLQKFKSGYLIAFKFVFPLYHIKILVWFVQFIPL